jgi:hypothetical protein
MCQKTESGYIKSKTDNTCLQFYSRRVSKIEYTLKLMTLKCIYIILMGDGFTRTMRVKCEKWYWCMPKSYIKKWEKMLEKCGQFRPSKFFSRLPYWPFFKKSIKKNPSTYPLRSFVSKTQRDEHLKDKRKAVLDPMADNDLYASALTSSQQFSVG